MGGTTVWGRHVVVATGSRAHDPADPRARGGRLPHERNRLHRPNAAGQPPLMGGGPDRHRARPGLPPPRLEGHDRVVVTAHLPEGRRRRRRGPREAAAGGRRHDPRRRAATKVDDAGRREGRHREDRGRRRVRRRGGRDPRGDRPAPEHRRASTSRARREVRSEKRHRHRREVPYERPVRLGDRRRGRPLPLHALGGLPGGYRPAQHPLPGRSRDVRRRRTRPGSRTPTPRSPTWASARTTRRRRDVPHRVFRADFLHNDRAVCDGTQDEQLREGARRPEGEDPRAPRSSTRTPATCSARSSSRRRTGSASRRSAR